MVRSNGETRKRQGSVLVLDVSVGLARIRLLVHVSRLRPLGSFQKELRSGIDGRVITTL